jgi:heptaprenyl diphosphate synthase
MKTKTLARFALLTALSLVLGYVESLIPIVPTVPGIKLGLGNTVLLYAVYMGTTLEASLLMLCKVFLSSMLFGGGFSAMLYSLAGGVLSLAVMLLLVRLPKVGVIGVSACGAVSHNIGQIAMASVLLGVGSVWAYFPVLVLSGLVMGPLTGSVALAVFRSLKKANRGETYRFPPRSFRESWKMDVFLLVIFVAIAGVSWLFLSRSGLDMDKVPGGNASESEYYVEVYKNNSVLYEIPVTDYGTYKIYDSASGNENVFVIDADGVHMESANCPDKICIHQGAIQPGSTTPITCLPHKVVLSIVSRDEIPEDFNLSEQDYSQIQVEDDAA